MSAEEKSPETAGIAAPPARNRSETSPAAGPPPISAPCPSGRTAKVAAACPPVCSNPAGADIAEPAPRSQSSCPLGPEAMSAEEKSPETAGIAAPPARNRSETSPAAGPPPISAPWPFGRASKVAATCPLNWSTGADTAEPAPRSQSSCPLGPEAMSAEEKIPETAAIAAPP